jgi:hypothetical protein
MGFVKASYLDSIDSLKLAISKVTGIGWLAASQPFVATLSFLLPENHYWPSVALAGLGLSSILIIVWWSAANYGMLPNLLILTAAALWLGMRQMDLDSQKELRSLMTTHHKEQIEQKQALNEPDSLPIPVRTWLKRSVIQGSDCRRHLG